MKLKGELRITQYTSNQKPYKSIEIQLQDELSGVEVFSVDVPIEQYGELVSGSGVDVTYELGHVELVGMVREYKSVAIPVDSSIMFYSLSDDEVRGILSQYEKDGWHLYDSDFKNHYKHNYKNGTIPVGAVRFVENK